MLEKHLHLTCKNKLHRGDSILWATSAGSSSSARMDCIGFGRAHLSMLRTRIGGMEGSKGSRQSGGSRNIVSG